MAAFALRAPSTTLPSARRYSTSISTGVVVVVDDEHGEAVQRLATAGQEPKVAASARVRLLAREAFSSRHPTHPQGVGEGAKVNAASLPQRRARRARPPRLRTDALRSEHAQFSAVIIPALGPRSRLGPRRLDARPRRSRRCYSLLRSASLVRRGRLSCSWLLAVLTAGAGSQPYCMGRHG
jgi:hypothetical protein